LLHSLHLFKSSMQFSQLLALQASPDCGIF
jgi:hypothetical protein